MTRIATDLEIALVMRTFGRYVVQRGNRLTITLPDRVFEGDIEEVFTAAADYLKSGVTEKRLEALETAAKNATEGLWVMTSIDPYGNGIFDIRIDDHIVAHSLIWANARFITAANPRVVLELIAEIRRLANIPKLVP